MSVDWNCNKVIEMPHYRELEADSEPAPAHIGRYDAVLYVGLSILGLCTLVALAWVTLAWRII